jgi:hypothetical protein
LKVGDLLLALPPPQCSARLSSVVVQISQCSAPAPHFVVKCCRIFFFLNEKYPTSLSGKPQADFSLNRWKNAIFTDVTPHKKAIPAAILVFCVKTQRGTRLMTALRATYNFSRWFCVTS